MDLDDNKLDAPLPIVDIDGVLAGGKQVDLDITLQNDDRDVIYGIVRDCFKDPVKDAVVKLVEVDYENGEKQLKPVSHTFTDDDGEFVFGPLCPDRKYSIQIWANKVKHIKVCKKCHHEGKCLKGIRLDCRRENDSCELDLSNDCSMCDTVNSDKCPVLPCSKKQYPKCGCLIH